MAKERINKGSTFNKNFNYSVDKSKLDKFGCAVVEVTNTDTGETRKLLNPNQKGHLYVGELFKNQSATTGKPLTKAQRTYRQGYLKAREDNAKVHCAKQGKKYGKGSRPHSVVNVLFGKK